MTDEDEIRSLVQTWMEATKAGDIDTVLDLMSEDVVFLTAGRPPMIGRATYAAAARALAGPDAPHFDGRSEIKEIRIAGDLAYMWTKLTVEVTPPGNAPKITRTGDTLTVLRKENGKWVIARDANMLVAAPAAGGSDP